MATTGSMNSSPNFVRFLAICQAFRRIPVVLSRRTKSSWTAWSWVLISKPSSIRPDEVPDVTWSAYALSAEEISVDSSSMRVYIAYASFLVVAIFSCVKY
jgi:hypothetical protein